MKKYAWFYAVLLLISQSVLASFAEEEPILLKPVFSSDVFPKYVLPYLNHRDVDAFSYTAFAFLKATALFYQKRLFKEFGIELNLDGRNRSESAARDTYCSIHENLYATAIGGSGLIVRAGNLQAHQEREAYLAFLAIRTDICFRLKNLNFTPLISGSIGHTPLNDNELLLLGSILEKAPNITHLNFSHQVYDDETLGLISDIVNDAVRSKSLWVRVRNEEYAIYLSSLKRNGNIRYIYG